MPNPPTLQDLKRFKRDISFKRKKLIFNGVVDSTPSSPQYIPELPGFISQPLLGLTNGDTLGPDNENEFISQYTTDTFLTVNGQPIVKNYFFASDFYKISGFPSDFLYNFNQSNYFINDNFITQNKNLSNFTVPTPGSYTVKRNFYDNNGIEISSTFDSINFIDFQINSFTLSSSLGYSLSTGYTELYFSGNAPPTTEISLYNPDNNIIVGESPIMLNPKIYNLGASRFFADGDSFSPGFVPNSSISYIPIIIGNSFTLPHELYNLDELPPISGTIFYDYGYPDNYTPVNFKYNITNGGGFYVYSKFRINNQLINFTNEEALSSKFFINASQTFNEPFTGTKSVYLTTTNTLTYETLTSKIDLNFRIDTPDYWERRSRNIQTLFQFISGDQNPNYKKDKFQFLKTDSNTFRISGDWNNEFWGYNYRNILNFSGVSFQRLQNDDLNRRNVTLITPQHGITNAHYSPNVGEILFFYDHTNGEAVSGKIESRTRLYPGGNDSNFDTNNPAIVEPMLIKFEEPILNENIKIYKIPFMDINVIPGNLLPIVNTAGMRAFNTDRCASLGYNTLSRKSSRVVSTFDSLTSIVGHNPQKIEKISDLSASNSTFVDKDISFSLSGVSIGDSSNPVFFLYEKELFYIGGYLAGLTNWFGDEINFIPLLEGLSSLGTEGYTVTAENLFVGTSLNDTDKYRHPETSNLKYLNVTVQEYSGQNYFYIDGNRAPSIDLLYGYTYRFLQDNVSNNTHPLRFSTTNDGSSIYDDLVSVVGVPGSPGAYTEIKVRKNTPNLFYYCQNHPNMGSNLTIKHENR